MKSIRTLIPDVQALLKTEGWFTHELAQEFSREVETRLTQHFNKEQKPRLRMSKLGWTCPKALWHSIHTPEEEEPLPPWAKFKYSFGHIIEALAICLAKAAGHTVAGEQDAIHLEGISGSRDCIIDGCVVDVKSASSRSFLKFKNGSIRENDSFGYLHQLDAYVVGSSEDELVTVKDRGYLWAIDKQLGSMTLYEHRVRENSIRERITQAKAIIARETPPGCTCGTEPDGESGNIKLDVVAGYNQFKYACFPHLRTFLYEGGPRYLTVVARKPMKRDRRTPIVEVDRYGKIVYNT
jgi:hypothetical protein